MVKYNAKNIMYRLTGNNPVEILFIGDKSEYRYTCPICGSEHNKFYMDAKTGVWSCFNHGGSGNLINLVKEVLDCTTLKAKEFLIDSEMTVEEQVPELAEADNMFDKVALLLAKGSEPIKSNTINKIMPKLPTNTKRLLDNLNSYDAIPFFRYLKKRDVSLQDIKDADIRYVINGDFKTASDKDMTIYNSIIFITHINKQPVYWNSRSIEANPYLKSFNASGKNTEYTRRDVVFGLDKVYNKDIVVCEGVFNALMVNDSKHRGVATFGKQVTDIQVKDIIEKLGSDNKLILYLDNDAKQEELKLADKCIEFGCEPSQLFIVNSPYGDNDANDIGRKNALDLVNKAVNYNLDFRLKYIFN